MVVLAVLALAVPARAVQLQVSSAEVASPGDLAEVCVSLHTDGAGSRRRAGRPGVGRRLRDADGAESCRIEPATGKQLFARVLGSRDFALRTVVLSLADVDPIPDGRLYCCDFRLSRRRRTLLHRSALERFGASDSFGNEYRRA